jgi:hypothetical protein
MLQQPSNSWSATFLSRSARRSSVALTSLTRMNCAAFGGFGAGAEFDSRIVADVLAADAAVVGGIWPDWNASTAVGAA